MTTLQTPVAAPPAPARPSRPVRVLHLIKTLNLGGAETNLANLVRALDPARIECHVGYSLGGEIEDRFRDAGVRLFKYADRAHKVRSAATFGIVRRLAAYARANGIDVVHTHNFNSHAWGSFAAKLAGAKLVEHVHDFRYVDKAEYARRRGDNGQYGFARLFAGWPDAVVVLTEQNREHLVARGLARPERVRRIPNGVPLAEARPAVDRAALRRELGIPEGAPVVMTAARVAPEKNVDLVLRIAARVTMRVPETVFLVAGDGPLLETLRAEARAMGLGGRVVWAGFRPDTRELLSLADVFLLPSFLELHSIAALEAMAAGVPPVLSAEVGCHGEFVKSGSNGVLLDPFRDAGWAEAVTRLLTDAPLRERLGAEARRTCRELFEIGSVARRFEALYGELAAARGARRC